MGNIVTTIKRFLSNKNTVTILGVLLGIVVLYWGYNRQIDKAIDTVSIPYAKKTIVATSEIKQEDIGSIEVLRSTITSNKTLISNVTNIINQTQPYCVTTGTSVPNGGFFYTEQVVPCNQIPNSVFDNMPDGYKPFTLSVNIHSTYGNSMYPGDYIDLYVKMPSSDGKFVYGKFIEKLPILDVRDSNGKSVFATSQTATPAELLFAVPADLYLLLSKANYVSDVTIVPVPGNATYTSEVGETSISSEWLREQILNYTSAIPDEVVE